MCAKLSVYLMSDPRIFNRWVLTGKTDEGIKIYAHKNEKSDAKQEIERNGLELKPNGELVRYELSPKGSLVQYTGKYKIDGNTMYTYFKNHYLDSLYKIVELNDKVLKII